MLPNTKISEPLSAALDEGRIVVLAGAGISMLAPSSLPSWWMFNSALLTEIKATARTILPHSADALSGLTMDNIPVTAFSEYIVNTFAGISYFPLLELLDSSKPNANHVALAQLARNRKIRALITTNFDTLLEQAFRHMLIPLQVILPREDPASDTGVCQLYKIHGSVSESLTLVDTVSQKLRGLPQFLLRRVTQLFTENHLLVIGFSGEDLKFDEAYLPIQEAAANRGVTWLVRPDSKAPPMIQSLAQIPESRVEIMEDVLPVFFARLGIEIPETIAALESTPATLIAQRLQARIHEWLAEPDVGPAPCTALCIQLLEHAGRIDDAARIRANLADFVRQHRTHLSFGPAFRVLYEAALKQHDPQTAIEWVEREMDLGELIYHPLEVAGPISPEILKERLQNLSGAANNAAVAYRIIGDHDASLEALKIANSIALETQDFRRVSQARLNMAIVFEAQRRSPEEILKQLWISQGFASEAGSFSGQIEALLRRARVLIDIVEYDSAWAALDRVTHILKVANALMYEVMLSLLYAEIEVRRGRADEAYSRLNEILAKAENLGAMTAVQGIRAETIWLLWFYTPLRAKLAQLREVWLQWSLANGLALLTNDSPMHLQLEEQRLVIILSGELSPEPYFRTKLSHYSREESEIRELIIQAEFSGKLDGLPMLLERLCSSRLEWTECMRLDDLAYALIVTSKRSGSALLQCKGWNYQGIASDRLGELTSAATAYERGLTTAPPGSSLEARLTGNFGLIRSMIQPEAAADTLQKAAEMFASLSDAHNEIRTRRSLAQHFASSGEMERALEEGDVAVSLCRELTEPLLICKGLGAQLFAWRRRPELLAKLPGGIQVARLFHNLPPEEQFRDEIVDESLILRSSPMTESAPEFESSVWSALNHYSRRSRPLAVAHCLEQLAIHADACEQWDRSIEVLERAKFLYWTLGSIRGEVRVWAHEAMACLLSGNPERALEAANASIHIGEVLEGSRSVAIAYAVGTLANSVLKKRRDARTYRKEALSRLEAFYETELIDLRKQL